MTTWFVRYGATKFGGAENYLRRIVAALENSGQDVGVYSTEQYGYKTILLPKKGKKPSFLYLKQLANQILQSRQDHIGILFALERLPCADIYRAGDGVHKAWLEIKAKHQSGLKTKFEQLNPLHKTYLSLEEQTFNNSKIIIANSKRGADEIVYHYGITRDKIRVVYNGAPHPVVMPDKQCAKAALECEYNLRSNLPLILYTGSGFFRKGVKDFLNILSFLRIPFNAMVVGKDKKQAQYESYAKSLGLGSNVIFVGAQSPMDKFYAAADVFLFPTLYEPFSNACLEAMGYGAVLFTTPQNGVAEILPNSNFIINDVQSSAFTLGALLSDKTALDKNSQEHRDVALKYSVERNVKETLAVIKELS